VNINSLISKNRETIEGAQSSSKLNTETGTNNINMAVKSTYDHNLELKKIFDSKCIEKPDPFYGNQHDQYLIPNDIIEAMAMKDSNTKHKKGNQIIYNI